MPARYAWRAPVGSPCPADATTASSVAISLRRAAGWRRPMPAWRAGDSDSRSCNVSTRPRQYSNSDSCPSAMPTACTASRNSSSCGRGRRRRTGKASSASGRRSIGCSPPSCWRCNWSASTAMVCPSRDRIASSWVAEIAGSGSSRRPSTSAMTRSRAEASCRSSVGSAARMPSAAIRSSWPGLATCADTSAGSTRCSLPAEGSPPAWNPRWASSSSPCGGRCIQRSASRSRSAGRNPGSRTWMRSSSGGWVANRRAARLP